MKRIIFLSLVGLSLVLVGCIQQPIENQDTDANQPLMDNIDNNDVQPQIKNCFQIDGACCPTEEPCALSAPQCPAGTQPAFKGCSEECTPLFDCIADEAKETDDWQSFNNPQMEFQFDYPMEWEMNPSSVSGVRKTISFKDEVNGYPGNGYLVFSLSYMPNQGGVTLQDWSGERVKQGREKIAELTIGGLKAHKLMLPESEAGPNYLFISADSQTMYDLQFTGVKTETIERILSSFSFTD